MGPRSLRGGPASGTEPWASVAAGRESLQPLLARNLARHPSYFPAPGERAGGKGRRSVLPERSERTFISRPAWGWVFTNHREKHQVLQRAVECTLHNDKFIPKKHLHIR